MANEKSRGNKNLKGSPKGGTRFPMQGLSDCLEWNKKLVSKTHLSAQPEDLILSGVVGSTSSLGKVRISSMKQFGLIDGNAKAYAASDLAKQLNSSPEEEVMALIRSCFFKPPLFEKIFETFQGDTVSKAKLKQRAADLSVHPDKCEQAIEQYCDSAIAAKLINLEGDNVVHSLLNDIQVENSENVALDEAEQDSLSESNDDEEQFFEKPAENNFTKTSTKSGINININIDSTMDVEKLSKQLELLKKFGAI
jgi:hypothetical protein